MPRWCNAGPYSGTVQYLALQKALHSYLDEATEQIIREEVYNDAGEAAERLG
jgi:hypothetical protein